MADSTEETIENTEQVEAPVSEATQAGVKNLMKS